MVTWRSYQKSRARIYPLPENAFNFTEVVADGNRGFRSAHGRESEARQRLLEHPNSGPEGYLRDVPVTSGAEVYL